MIQEVPLSQRAVRPRRPIKMVGGVLCRLIALTSLAASTFNTITVRATPGSVKQKKKKKNSHTHTLSLCIFLSNNTQVEVSTPSFVEPEGLLFCLATPGASLSDATASLVSLAQGGGQFDQTGAQTVFDFGSSGGSLEDVSFFQVRDQVLCASFFAPIDHLPLLTTPSPTPPATRRRKRPSGSRTPSSTELCTTSLVRTSTSQSRTPGGGTTIFNSRTGMPWYRRRRPGRATAPTAFCSPGRGRQGRGTLWS